MKTQFKLLAAGIACAAIGLSSQKALAQPTLTNFGYGTMRTDRTASGQ